MCIRDSAKRGAFLALSGRRKEKLTDVAKKCEELGGKVVTYCLDVTDQHATKESIQDFLSKISNIDLVIVDLYPFEKTVKSGESEKNIIEKIDIGGISLIRAAAKNFNDVICVSSKDDYNEFLSLLNKNSGRFNELVRKKYAAKAFNISSHYDTAIFNYFNSEIDSFKISFNDGRSLRYGENPHQSGVFFGDFNSLFDQLNGKELSYNNFLDIDSAVNLIFEFKDDAPTFAILKHNNACGLSTRNSVLEAYKDALAGDPVSAFGGVLITNKTIDFSSAEEINKLFCEVVIAPSFEDDALELLKLSLIHI